MGHFLKTKTHHAHEWLLEMIEIFFIVIIKYREHLVSEFYEVKLLSAVTITRFVKELGLQLSTTYNFEMWLL